MQVIPRPNSPNITDVPGREQPVWPPDKPGPGRSVQRRSITPASFCLCLAPVAALGGMVLGIRMGISQDFTLAPAHAHLNLLGWVTLALYGLYYRTSGRTGGWLGWTQVIAGASGAMLMAVGLGLYLASGDHGYFPLIVTGSLLAVLGMVLFLVIVALDVLTVESSHDTVSRA